MGLEEISWENIDDWIQMAQDRSNCRAFVNVVMKAGVSLNAGNFFTG
jgi:hypothetical protein